MDKLFKDSLKYIHNPMLKKNLKSAHFQNGISKVAKEFKTVDDYLNYFTKLIYVKETTDSMTMTSLKNQKKDMASNISSLKKTIKFLESLNTGSIDLTNDFFRISRIKSDRSEFLSDYSTSLAFMSSLSDSYKKYKTSSSLIEKITFLELNKSRLSKPHFFIIMLADINHSTFKNNNCYTDSIADITLAFFGKDLSYPAVRKIVERKKQIIGKIYPLN